MGKILEERWLIELSGNNWATMLHSSRINSYYIDYTLLRTFLYSLLLSFFGFCSWTDTALLRETNLEREFLMLKKLIKNIEAIRCNSLSFFIAQCHHVFQDFKNDSNPFINWPRAAGQCSGTWIQVNESKSQQSSAPLGGPQTLIVLIFHIFLTSYFVLVLKTLNWHNPSFVFK